MTLKERILDLLMEKCAEEGLETKPRIYEMARDLDADNDDVIKAVKELESEGLIEYVTDATGGGESHVCPAVGGEDLFKKKIIDMVNEKGRVELEEIEKSLKTDKYRVGEIASQLAEEGKIKFACSSRYLRPA